VTQAARDDEAVALDYAYARALDERQDGRKQHLASLLASGCAPAVKARLANYMKSLTGTASAGRVRSIEIAGCSEGGDTNTIRAWIAMLTIWSGSHIVHATEIAGVEGMNANRGTLFGEIPTSCPVTRHVLITFGHLLDITAIDICQLKHDGALGKLTLIMHDEDEKMELFRQDLPLQEWNNVNVVLLKDASAPPLPVPCTAVRIIGGGNHLQIKKLMMWSGDRLITPADVNRTASSSSYDSQHGNPMRVFEDVGSDWSAFCTGASEEEWVTYFLEPQLPATQVKIFNRTDCCSERLALYKLQIMCGEHVIAERQLTKEAIQTYQF
jgi:hypothetical protein